jgi:hypothetical protein
MLDIKETGNLKVLMLINLGNKINGGVVDYNPKYASMLV